MILYPLLDGAKWYLYPLLGGTTKKISGSLRSPWFVPPTSVNVAPPLTTRRVTLPCDVTRLFSVTVTWCSRMLWLEPESQQSLVICRSGINWRYLFIFCTPLCLFVFSLSPVAFVSVFLLVLVKVLPSSFIFDVWLQQRFMRETDFLSSLMCFVAAVTSRTMFLDRLPLHGLSHRFYALSGITSD